MTEKKKTIPEFASEDEEREFWSREDTTDYVDWSKARRVHFSNLEGTFREVRLSLTGKLLDEIELLAEKKDVPVEALIDAYLGEKLLEEREDVRARATDVHFGDEEMTVDLADGRSLTVPLAWYPRLLGASAKEREHWELVGGGEGIHWPDVDEDLSVRGLLRGTKAPGAQV